jgi:hypothetical protein
MDKLAALTARAKERPVWNSFAEFARLRSVGRRAAAMNHLNGFLDDACAWDFYARFEFTKWALEESRQFSDRGFFLPHPAQVRLIVPTLREWLDVAPFDAEPHLWLGLLRCDDPSRHLKRALELDPTCEPARQTLAQWILADIEYNQHELPAFYIHDPRDDLKALDQATRLVQASAVEEWANDIRREIIDLRARTEVWLQAHPGPGDFAIH